MRLNDEITVYTRTAGTVTSPYGDPIDVESAGVLLRAYVEPLDATEDEINRDTRRSRYFVAVDAEGGVNALSRVVWDGDSYEVVGEPQPFKGIRGLHHYEFEMRRTVA